MRGAARRGCSIARRERRLAHCPACGAAVPEIRRCKSHWVHRVIASFPPAYGRPALDETGGKACGGAMMVLLSDRGRRSLEPESPVASWTRGASKTPTGAKGGNAWERAC